ncbi:MAG: hypothetical protein WA110_07085, partial [Anaerolineaceae bacterium]
MVALLAGLALLLPGLCWWVWLGDRDKDPIEALVGIMGVSVSVISGLALFFYFIRMSVTPAIMGGLIGFFLAGTVVGIIRTRASGFSWGWA